MFGRERMGGVALSPHGTDCRRGSVRLHQPFSGGKINAVSGPYA